MLNLIRAISAHVHLTEDDVQLIGMLFKQKQLAANEYLVTSGMVCREFAFVEKGLFMHSINNEGKEQTIYFCAENNFVCDYESFISKTASKKNIMALEPSVIYSISWTKMQQFFEKVSSGERFGRLLIEEIFIRVIGHIISSYTDSATERYLKFLHVYSHIQQRIPQYYIASFVGITPQSLSRIRRKMISK